MSARKQTPTALTLAKNGREITRANDIEKRAKKARQAYNLRLEGKSWWHIAEEMKITELDASSMVAESIRAASALVDESEKRQIMAIELDRLDQLTRAVWPTAMAGDSRSIDSVLKIMAHRSRLVGLEDALANRQVTLNTIVVPGNTVEYVNSLRALTGATQ